MVSERETLPSRHPRRSTDATPHEAAEPHDAMGLMDAPAARARRSGVARFPTCRVTESESPAYPATTTPVASPIFRRCRLTSFATRDG